MRLWITGREVKSRGQFGFRDLFQLISIKDIRQERKGPVVQEHVLHTFLFETCFVIIILALSLSFNLICLPLNPWNRFVLPWTPCNWPLQYSWAFFFFIKTFDTINHIAICNKLAACGTLPQTVTWFQSQLCQLRAVVGKSDSSSPARRAVSCECRALTTWRYQGLELQICTCLQVLLYTSNNLLSIRATSLQSRLSDSICEV